MKAELISRLEELLAKDPLDVANDVRALQKEYQKIWTQEFEKARQEHLGEGGRGREFEHHKNAEDNRFESLIEQFGKRRKEAEAKQAAEQARNLTIRQEIIAKIRDLSHVSENVSVAMRKLHELQTQWRETGQVSPHKYKEIQAEYSKAMEEIHYNLKIFRELQEHDLKKNYDHKKEVIEKLKAILALENIKEAERLIKVYRNEWEEIGPVPHAKWEELKGEYKSALDEVYTRIKSHYNALEEQKEQNLKLKEAMVEKVRAIVESTGEDSKPAKWNEATEAILSIQAEWKTVGRTTEKEGDRVWADFRAVCDSFFEKKKSYFSGLNEKFSGIRKEKAALIAKAEELKASTDWQRTSSELIRLQDAWKKYPAQGDKEEPRLFARFRKACNAFFDAKKAHFAQIDESYSHNLVKKEEILSRLNAYTLSEDNKANRDALREFSLEWSTAGHVPAKDKKRVNDAFYNRLEELYSQMHVDQKEKAALQFRTKLDRLGASENPREQLRREADHLKRIMDEISSKILTYENNLGFFKSAKGSTMLDELQGKVQSERERLAELAAKRKMVNEEISRLNKAEQKAEA
jgi:hypothetical protein